MGRVADRLLSRLHTAFSKDAERSLALRIRHPSEAGWQIADYSLTLTASGTPTAFDLRDYTIGSLADAIVSAGYTVEYRNVDIDHLDAINLMPGSGHESESNGDHIYIHTALLHVLLGVVGLSDEHAKAMIDVAISQLILPQSKEEWSDLFGEIFGVPREDDEGDVDYTQRIIEEVTRLRNSPAPMLRNIKRITGSDLSMWEPWKHIFRWDMHPWDDGFFFEGAPIYQYHTAQLVSEEPKLDWSREIAEAEADRPAGTILLDLAIQLAPREIIVGAPAISMGRKDTISLATYLNGYWLLDENWQLDDSIGPPETVLSARNVLGLSNTGLRGPYTETGSEGGWTGYWDGRTWGVTVIVPEMYPPDEYNYPA